MPCDDSSSRIEVRVDGEDRIAGFRFRKMTCSKGIGGDLGFEDYCRGRGIDEIRSLPIESVFRDLDVTDADDRFLLYLEWEALRAALDRYVGEDEHLDSERFRIASIEWDGSGAEIIQIIRPPKNMPAIIACTLTK